MELVQRRNTHSQNVHQVERIASIIAGGALGYFGIREGLSKHFVPAAGLALAGAALIKRGGTGYCDLYHAFGVNTHTPSNNPAILYQQGIRVDRSITINARREDVYTFWRDLQNLPSFMTNVCCVKTLDEKRSHWVVDGPAGKKMEWDAEIINDIPNELIAWKSLPGAEVDNAGSVRFEHASAGRGTRLSVSLQYNPPAGPAGAMIAKLFGKEPEQEIDFELRRLKNILEAGEIPTSHGQPTGRNDKADQARQSVKKQGDDVHDASEQSFPASDAPAYSH